MFEMNRLTAISNISNSALSACHKSLYILAVHKSCQVNIIPANCIQAVARNFVWGAGSICGWTNEWSKAWSLGRRGWENFGNFCYFGAYLTTFFTTFWLHAWS